MIKGIHHVAIICSEYQRSKHFYTAIMGFDFVAENYQSHRDSYKLDLRLPDGSQLELFSFVSAPERLSYPEACGLRHLALRTADLDKTISHLSSHGVETESIRIDEYTGKRYVFLQDPDGLPIELYEE